MRLRERWWLYRWLDAYRGLGWFIGAVFFLAMAILYVLLTVGAIPSSGTATWYQATTAVIALFAACVWFYRWSEAFLGVT